MKVLIAGQYFPPEITAGANRVHGFASGLARRGHRVEVVCEAPSHPAGEIAPGYGKRLVDRREMDGFMVSYVWVRATPNKAMRSRVTNYASYAATAALAGIRAAKPDVVLASSPPLTVGSVGSMLAARHRKPWVLDVRDLWPDVAVALGQVGEGAVLRIAERLERRLYRSASAITVTSAPVGETIAGRGGDQKVSVVPNGTTTTFLDAGERDSDPSLLRSADGRFTWTYAGNVGLVAGLEGALDAALLLGDGFQLIILGEGPRREAIRRRAAELPDGVVHFIDPAPPEQAAALMRASDALIVTRAPNPSMDDMVLSKLYDSCAVGRPVVVAAAGETARIAAEADAALCVPPGDAPALADAIRRLRDEDGLAGKVAASARRFAMLNSRDRGVERMEAILECCVSRAERQGRGSASSDR